MLFWKKKKEQIEEAVEEIVETVEEKIDEIADAVEEKIEELGDKIEEVTDAIEDKVESVAEEIKEEIEAPEEEKKGFFARLRDGLGKTRTSISDKVSEVFKSFKKIDEDFYEELEEALIPGARQAFPGSRRWEQRGILLSRQYYLQAVCNRNACNNKR